MTDYNDFKDIMSTLENDQDADSDNRREVKEARDFLHKKDGQWEPSILSDWSQRPRYTFDKCNPIVDQIITDIEKTDFEIAVNMASGDASKETANTFAGLVRNTEKISSARHIYSRCGRDIAVGGISGFEIRHKYVCHSSFDQDLVMMPIFNYPERVFFDAGSKTQTHEDAEHCFVYSSINPDQYEKEWPKGSGVSIGETLPYSSYAHKAEKVTICRLFYLINILFY